MNFPVFFLAHRHLFGNLAADGSDFAFEISQPSFLRVQIDDGPQSFVAELDLIFL